MKMLRRPLQAVLLLVLLGLSSAGCYGKFALTGWVHDFNGKVTQNRFVHTLVMWGLFIIPVYEIAVLGDAVIFNTVECFTGRNPLDGMTPAPKVKVTTDASGAELLEGESNGALYGLSWEDTQTIRVTRNGTFAGTARIESEGRITLTDTQGNSVEIFVPKGS